MIFSKLIKMQNFEKKKPPFKSKVIFVFYFNFQSNVGEWKILYRQEKQRVAIKSSLLRDEKLEENTSLGSNGDEIHL